MKTIRAVRGSAVLAAVMLLVAEAHVRADFNIYGFAQLDYIQDLDRVDPAWDATLRPSRIPTTKGIFGSDGQATLSVRQSMFGVEGTIPAAGGDIYATFEFDLFGVGPDEEQVVMRVRHVYGQYGDFLAGQTDSLFMAGDAFHRGEYASVNFLVHPAKEMFYGIEYLWGKRTDNDDATGTDQRIQLSWQYHFISNAGLKPE